MNDKIIEKYRLLREEIEKYNNSYYNLDNPLISDYEYDKKIKELNDLEKQYPDLKDNLSPTQKIGGIAAEKFSKVEHKRPMLSLSNTYSLNDLADFDARTKKNINSAYSYVLELKLDGLSISLIYKKGQLIKAITRGDGKIGEDVTENVMQISSIPKKLKESIDIEVRGEIILPIKEFQRINEQREELGEMVFANPRNAAAGTLRQLDANIVKERKLDCYLYYLVDAKNYGLKTHLEAITYLEKLGFKTTKVFTKCNDISDFEREIEYWNIKRKKLDYETDGLVIKINEFDLYDKLGYTAKSPKWAIAYKFKPDQIETKIISIDFQVGRTGVITPVANFEPVNLSGSIVKRASLHNFDEIKRKDIRLYDKVIIEKAAEIIPQVVLVLSDKRTGNEQIINEPSLCPSCNEKTHKFDNIVAIKCINPYCPEQLNRYIEYFSSRNCMNIKGLGDKITRKFIDLGILTNILDIYNLKNFKEMIISLDKMGEKNTDNLLESIEKSKENEYSKVLFSLGIDYVGKTTAELITANISDIDKLINSTYEDLVVIKGIGEKAANSIINYFKDENNLRIIKGLKELGFKLEQKNIETIYNENINEKTFLATGKFINFKREEIKELIKKNGGKYLSAVSANLDYLIVGEKAGSKLKKASDLGITILTEEEFENFLERN
ncbi:NAD-dependent DNA ligase LigA [Oceanivirga salmonicida]|uniref:NAD-dependent DNA ligase LigA n=1 Tax=Oceanivirga salmonicida TaxID=1769291 RepID=UPI0012E112D8|nr:NAD-dependent DNA ligase LigA [Oceanivirga salmonicida]